LARRTWLGLGGPRGPTGGLERLAAGAPSNQQAEAGSLRPARSDLSLVNRYGLKGLAPTCWGVAPERFCARWKGFPVKPLKGVRRVQSTPRERGRWITSRCRRLCPRLSGRHGPDSRQLPKNCEGWLAALLDGEHLMVALPIGDRSTTLQTIIHQATLGEPCEWKRGMAGGGAEHRGSSASVGPSSGVNSGGVHGRLKTCSSVQCSALAPSHGLHAALAGRPT